MTEPSATAPLLAPLVAGEAPHVWEDGTPMVRATNVCAKDPSRTIEGCVVLSKDKGAMLLGFGLHMRSVVEITAKAAKEERTPEEIEADAAAVKAEAEQEAALAEVSKKPPKKKKGGGSGGGDALVIPAAQLARAGEWVDATFGDMKCYCTRLATLHERPTRQDEARAQTREARRSLVESHREQFRRDRTVALHVECAARFSIGSGNYISWYHDEHLVAEYYGDSVAGNPHGVGYKLWSSGAWYKGEWVSGTMTTTKPSAPGFFSWADGRTYKGTFLNGKRHGRGFKTWPGGKGTYDGDFALGLEHGMGKRTYADGSVFEGRFRFGGRDGPGCLTRADGKKEKGAFKDPVSDELDSDDPAADGMPPPNADHDTPDLLSLATAKLAWAVANQPDLYPAQLLADLLPAPG